MKKILDITLVVMLVLTAFLTSCKLVQSGKSDGGDLKENEYAVIQTGIKEINKYGHIVLEVTPDEMTGLGYAVTDVISVKIGGELQLEMPIVLEYSDVDSGALLCRFKLKADESSVLLTINLGNIVTEYGIAEMNAVDHAPGYEIIRKDGYSLATPVVISMAKKGGYADEYILHTYASSMSNERSDYPELSDAEFANFRAVSVTGIRENALYRTSSPINPAIGRSAYADAALDSFGIKTIINMADNDEIMRSYPDFDDTNYSKRNVLALNMGMSVHEEDFRQKLAVAFRFIAANEAPYLIHCKEGKDRTGFAVAVLECLAGASLEEIVADYMLTYYNFYGVKANTVQYETIAKANILTSLSAELEVDLSDETAELSARAYDYLTRIGMTGEEIEKLKERICSL